MSYSNYINKLSSETKKALEESSNVNYEIQDLDSYQLFVTKRTSFNYRTILEALEASVKFLISNRINVKPNSYVQCKRMFSNILRNSLVTS